MSVMNAKFKLQSKHVTLVLHWVLITQVSLYCPNIITIET